MDRLRDVERRAWVNASGLALECAQVRGLVSLEQEPQFFADFAASWYHSPDKGQAERTLKFVMEWKPERD